MSWISENGLALYGAITGTLALGISYIGHRHNVERDRIKLLVEFGPHPNQAENLKRLRASPNAEQPWKGPPPNLVEFFVVTVRNVGNVAAPLTDVGITSKDGAKHAALVSVRHSSFSMLQRIPETPVEPLEPNACATFNVYLRREEHAFTAIAAYAIDQTGKEWRSRA